MVERRVSVKFSAEISNFKQAMADAAQATTKAKKASEEAGKAADQSAEEIKKQALAHHEAAKAAGLQYDNTGQLVTMNGKAVSSQQAAAHGLQTFSKEAYLAGRAAVAAGEDAEAAAKVAAEAEAKAAAAIEKRREAMERVGAIAMTAGVATLAGVGLAVKSYADFDKQMSSVDAATHETAGNMALLREAAIKAGADTSFSAVAAAKGIEEMAKAGVSTKDILGGGLAGALDLAAAGSLDVGEAAEIAASAMTQFKLKGDQLPHVADLLAAGAGKAQGSVQDLGAALNQSGLIAAQAGLTIEETTGGLAAFASAGLTGSDAGTSFKTMLGALTPNSAAAATAMSELGISAYDSQGKFIGLSEFAGNLKSSLAGLTDEQRNSTLETIFGSDAVRAASVLYEQGAEGVQKWEDAVNDAGYAADTAARMQDNLAGDLEKLGGAFDTALIQSGSGANEVLRGLVQGLEGVVDAVGKVPAPVLGAVTGLAALVGGAALLGGAFITVVPKIRDTRDALNELAPAGGKARSALSKAGAAAEGIGAFATAGLILAKFAEADYMSKIDTGMGKVADSLAEVSTNGPGASTALDDLFKDRSGGDLINTVTDLESAIKRTFNRDGGQQFNDWGESIINGMTGVKGSSQILGEQFERLDKGLADLVSGGKTADAAKSFDQIKKAAEDQGVSIEQLKEKFPQYADALKQAEAAAKTAAAEGKNVDGSLTDAGKAAEVAAKQTEEIEKALEEVGLAADGSVTDIEKFTQSLFNAGLIHLSASSASIAYQAAIDDLTASVTKNGTTLDINTEQGRANRSAFDGLATAAMNAATATATETLATQGADAAMASLQGSLRTSYDDLVRAAGQFGITGDEADTMARKALGIPDEVPIDTWVNDNATAKLDALKIKADGLDGRVVRLSVVEEYTKFIQDIRRPTVEDLNGDTFRPGGSLKVPGLTGGATGGRVADIMGFAGGGKVPGRAPFDLRLDNMLGLVNGRPIAVQSEEWIINGRSSKEYDRELAAINAGTFPKLPGYAQGGRAGREFSAQQLGYAPYRSDGSPAGGGMHVENLTISEQSDPVATFHEFNRRAIRLGS